MGEPISHTFYPVTFNYNTYRAELLFDDTSDDFESMGQLIQACYICPLFFSDDAVTCEGFDQTEHFLSAKVQVRGTIDQETATEAINGAACPYIDANTIVRKY